MRELYGIDISDSTISRITDKILPIVKEWKERPLDEIYAVVFLDVIHYHVRNEGRIVKQAVYIVKPMMSDLKRAYTAPMEDAALGALEDSGDKWDGKYPQISKSWKENWANLQTYLRYPEAVRCLIYTTYNDKKTMPPFLKNPATEGIF